jgi:hypothetical protein
VAPSGAAKTKRVNEANTLRGRNSRGAAKTVNCPETS